MSLRWIVLAICAFAAPAAPAEPRPNIVVLLTDDQAFDTLGVAGHPVVCTPHIDRLAAEGIRFTRAYHAIAQCAPSRASLLTGRYPHEHGVLDNDAQAQLVHVTLPELLAEVGYRCGLVGKWHLNDNAAVEELFPEFRVIAGRGGGGRSRDEEPGPLPRAHRAGPRSVYLAPRLLVNEADCRTNQFLTDTLGDAAIEFIASRDERPYFLWVAFHAPHSPWEPHPDFAYEPAQIDVPDSVADPLVGKPEAHSNFQALFDIEYLPGDQRRRRGRRRSPPDPPDDWQRLRADTAAYYSMISGIDLNVGRLMAALRAAPQDRPTLVLFLSDNGWMMGQHGMLSKGPVAYEELIRAPLIVWGPDRVPAGSVSDAVVSTLDLFPTLLEAAGVRPPTGPGVSLWPLIEGGPPPHEAVFVEYQQKGAGLYNPFLAAVGQRYKLVHRIRTDEWEAYDLASDPHEHISIAARIAEVPDLLELRARLVELRASPAVSDWLAEPPEQPEPARRRGRGFRRPGP